MKRCIICLLGAIIWTYTVSAQNYDPLNPPNSYQSADNPNYWKNKIPRAGYWQQDVHYNIDAVIDDKKNDINGKEKLNYWNNSPDTLERVYFHLYQNAFRSGSYLEQVRVDSKSPRYTKKKGYPENMGIDITRFAIKYPGSSTMVNADFSVDNTLLRCELAQPLLPGQKIEFEIDFVTHWDPRNGRRFAVYTTFGKKHFNGTHWYPRISVYDWKFGWTTDQHLGKEFYGDFGTFDVNLTFPNEYIVEATGNMLNRDEMLPAELRKKLDIKNFADKPWNSPPSEIIVPNGTTKTWKFHAENVHDFAFTADPHYRISETMWNGKRCIALAQEQHASGWQNASDYCAKVIETFSNDFGMYVYHKMIVADARSGMEYPMLTLDGGKDPTYRGLFVHEIGHNWFYGMVGNNETYRAALDEGFTQFLTGWGLHAIEGPDGYERDHGSKYKNKFKDRSHPVYNSVYRYYLRAAIKGEDGTLNTHSDQWFVNNYPGGGYSQVYRKTGTMLYNLQYVLGDELFLAAMRDYFSRWKIAHPYFDDFRYSIIRFTKVDLNWFFDQWIETEKTIDYKLGSIKKNKNSDDVFDIQFIRKGRMQMPIDFTVEAKDGNEFNFHIPNTDFVKKTDATVLSKWLGWDHVQPRYNATVIIPSGIKNVTIDTTNRLADINQLNNVKKFPLTFDFDSRLYNPAEWREYSIKARPDVWYNNYDGIKVGFHFEGDYLRHKHNLSVDTWLNTGLAQSNLDERVAENDFDQISYIVRYNTPIDKIIPRASVEIDARHLDGLDRVEGGLSFLSVNKQTKFYSHFIYMRRENTTDLDYLLFPDEWLSARNNNTIETGLIHNYRYKKGNGNIDLNIRNSALGSDYDFAQATATIINKSKVGKLDVRTRAFAQYALGDLFARETNLYVYGANPEELSENKFTRSRAFFPDDWLGFGNDVNHFHHGGGLNLRGYSGYVIPVEEDGETTRFIYQGNTGASGSIEIDFDRVLNFRPKLFRNCLHFDPYVFADAGVININTVDEDLELSEIRANAGAGIAMTIKKFGPLEDVKPFTVRVDFPFVINRTPAVSPDFFDFRWVVGVGRSF